MRRVRLRRVRGHYAIASPESRRCRAEECSRTTGQSPDQAATVVVEDLERAGAALTTRTTPLVPSCGMLVAAAGILLKAEPTTDPIAEFFLGLSIVFAIVTLSFLSRALFSYAGRRNVGLAPTVDDIAFARDCLVRKHSSARRGSWLAGFALACLIIGVLVGAQINIHVG